MSYLGYAICLRLPTVLLGWLWNVDWYSILEHHGIKFIDWFLNDKSARRQKLRSVTLVHSIPPKIQVLPAVFNLLEEAVIRSSRQTCSGWSSASSNNSRHKYWSAKSGNASKHCVKLSNQCLKKQLKCSWLFPKFSDGLQPTSHGIQPTSTSNGLQPTSDGCILQCMKSTHSSGSFVLAAGFSSSKWRVGP